MSAFWLASFIYLHLMLIQTYISNIFFCLMPFYSMVLMLQLSFALSGYFLMQHLKIFTGFPTIFKLFPQLYATVNILVYHNQLEIYTNSSEIQKHYSYITLFWFPSFFSYCHIYNKSIKSKLINTLIIITLYITLCDEKLIYGRISGIYLQLLLYSPSLS